MEKFEDFGVQEIKGWKNTFQFPDDASDAIIQVGDDFESEEIVFSNAASRIREELLDFTSVYKRGVIIRQFLTSMYTKPNKQNFIWSIVPQFRYRW